MKKIIKILIIILLLVFYAYLYNILSIKDSITVLEGQKLNFNLMTGLFLKETDNYETALASSNIKKETINKVGTNNLKLSLFGKIELKDINVSVIPKTKVIPLGNAIGMKLYTKGVLVVGMSEIETDNDTIERPYENSGIEEGDSIIEINENKVNTTEELINQVQNSKGNKIIIKYLKNEKVIQTSITPVKVENDYKIGLWVRDAAAGVGTLTFYEPSTKLFMSLGHGIVDIDTNEIVEISSGELVTANIISIIKGQKNIPGELRGTIKNGNPIGKIYKNTDMGVYGRMESKEYMSSNFGEMEVASRDEITQGKAIIICQIDNLEPKEYEIEIEKIYTKDNEDNKSMLIKITDENLLEKTGGIIQGMSGSPIIQNGKFIGAVTNVLVKSPTQGYGIFADLLIKQVKSID